MSYKQNHYEGPIKRATSRAQANRLLKDKDALDERQWRRLVEGDCSFHIHSKTNVTHQLWTDEKEGTVALQKCIGYW